MNKLKQKISMGIVALWSAAAFALPSQEAVMAAVKAGNYPQAESMMQEVVAAKPQSAKAHYVYAEILAHDAKFDEAARQAKEARTLDPAISFTDPEKFRSFEQTLQREQAPQTRHPAEGTAAVAQYGGASPYQQHTGGVPGWVWGVGLAFVAFLVWRSVTRRAAMTPNIVPAGAGYGSPTGYGQPGYGQPGYGQPGYGGYGMGQAPGSGMLRTGLAAAGGLAAGVLAEKYFEGQREREANGGLGGGSNYVDDGSAQAASELESRPIDFGSGDGWGGGGDSSGDFGGGGGSSDDGGW